MKYKIGLKEYRDLFEQAPVGIFVLNPDGYFILVNHRFCEITGYSQKALLQMHILDTYLESEVDLFTSRLAQLKIKKEMLVERSIMRKDRTICYAQINLRVLDNGWLKGIINDVPLQNNITSQLEKNEEKFRQITEHIRDVFFLIDLNNGNFLYVSPGYETIWQQSINYVLNHPTSWMTMIHPEDQSMVQNYIKKCFKQGTLRRIIGLFVLMDQYAGFTPVHIQFSIRSTNYTAV